MRLMDTKLLDKTGIEMIVVVPSFIPSVTRSQVSPRSLLCRKKRL